MNRYKKIKHHDNYIDVYSSNEEEDTSYNKESSDGISNNEVDVGSAKQF
jgi:hypothetical protein